MDSEKSMSLRLFIALHLGIDSQGKLIIDNHVWLFTEYVASKVIAG